jgi:hypothetical protein
MSRKRERFYLDVDADADIIRWLETQANKSAAIRKAIREAIRRRSVKETVRAVLKEELANVALVSADDTHETPASFNGDVDPEAGRLLDAMF